MSIYCGSEGILYMRNEITEFKILLDNCLNQAIPISVKFSCVKWAFERDEFDMAPYQCQIRPNLKEMNLTL